MEPVGESDEADSPPLRTFDPNLIAQVRNREFMQQRIVQPLPDGTLDGLRWVPTKQGVALSGPGCNGCHVLYWLDGTRIPGAPRLAEPSRARPFKFRGLPASHLESANRVLSALCLIWTKPCFCTR